MAELASAFVRVRADTRGFRGDVEQEVRSTTRRVAQIGAGVTGGVIAVELFRDVGRAIRGIGTAAAEEESRAELLGVAIRNAGASAKVAGRDIEDLIDAESRLTGFTDQELSSALARLVQATGDTSKAMKDLRLAEDVARIRKIELGQAAVALAKAEQGSATALARLGIIVPRVTTEYDRLVENHDRLVASGAKLSKQDQLVYKQALQVAQARDKQATKTGLLATVEQRFGGSALRFGQTAQGAFARADVSLNEFIESLGESFLPPLTAGALKLADLVQRLQESEDAARGVEAIGSTVAQGFGAIGDAAETVGPALVEAAQGAQAVLGAIGVGPIIAGVAAYKALSIATTQSAASEGLYARVLTAGAAARVEATAATVALTAAERAHLITATAAAGGAGLFARGLGGLALGAAGGPAGLAVAGLAAVAGGVAFLISRESDLEQANSRLSASMGTLTAAYDNTSAAAQRLAENTAAIPTDKLAVATAKLAVEQAKANLANSDAAEGSLERRQLQQQVALATDQLRQAENRLAADLAAQPQLQDAVTAARQKQRQAIIAERRALEDLRGEAVKGAALPGRSGGRVRGGEDAQRAAEIRAAKAANDDFIASLRKRLQDEENLSPVVRRNTQLLIDFATRVGRVPTDREIKLIVNNTDAKASLEDLLLDLARIMDEAARRAGQGGSELAESFRRSVGQGLAEEHGQATRAAQAMARDLTDRAKDTVTTEGRDLGLTLNQAIARGLIDSRSEVIGEMRRTLADTIAQGEEQITEAVVSAKQNLASLGQSVGDDIAQLIDAGPLGQRIATLQAQLDAATRSDTRGDLKGTLRDARDKLAEAQRAVTTSRPQSAQQKADAAKFLQPFKDAVKDAENALKRFDTEGIIAGLQTQADKQKEVVRKGIADLVDQFNRGGITMQQFNTRFARIIGKADIDYKTAGAKLGTAFVAGFKDKLAVITEQVKALVGFVDRPGTGTGGRAIRPADTVEEVRTRVLQEQRDLQREIRDNTKRMADELDELNRQRGARQPTTNSSQAGRGQNGGVGTGTGTGARGGGSG